MLRYLRRANLRLELTVHSGQEDVEDDDEDRDGVGGGREIERKVEVGGRLRLLQADAPVLLANCRIWYVE